MTIDPATARAAGAAAERCDAQLQELRRRYPGALLHLRQFAERRGDPALGDWPEWCWVPMAAAAAVVTATPGGSPDDIARVAALATWRLGRGVYVLDDDVAAAAVAAANRSETIPAERILAGLPEFCCYVVLPELPTEGTDAVALKGLYVHLEHDANTGRPELRVLLDIDGSWDHLTPAIIYLNRATLTTAAADVVAQVRAGLVGATGTDLRAIPSGHDSDPLQGLQWAMGYMGWPVVLALTNPDVHVVGAERPGERPQRARLAADGTWRAAPEPRVWRVTATIPRPPLRPL